MYPQSMQQDVVEDMCEHDVIRDHLDAMFGPDAPPLEWDDDKQYSRAAVELYYLSHGGTPLTEAQLVDVFAGGWPRALDESADEDRLKAYGDKASKWVKVDEGTSA